MQKQAIDHQIKAFCYNLVKRGYLDSEYSTKLPELDFKLREDIHRLLLSPRFATNDGADEDKWDVVTAITNRQVGNQNVQFHFNLELHYKYHTLEPFSIHVALAGYKPYHIPIPRGSPIPGAFESLERAQKNAIPLPPNKRNIDKGRGGPKL